MNTVPSPEFPSDHGPSTVMSVNAQITFAAINLATAFVSKNELPASEVPEFLRTLYKTILELPSTLVGDGSAEAADAAGSFHKSPAVIAESLKADGIISFIDGKKYKVLTRHLNRHGLTAETYRQRYGLPLDYPMVTPAYSAERAELARTSGLGQSRKGKTKAAAAAPDRRDRVELIGIRYHWPNLGLAQGFDHVFGHNPLRLRWFYDATHVGDTVAIPSQRQFSPLYPSYRSAFADLLGVRFIATGVPVEQIDTSLKPGDKVTIYVHPLRSGARGGSYAGVRFANGSTLGDVS